MNNDKINETITPGDFCTSTPPYFN